MNRSKLNKVVQKAHGTVGMCRVLTKNGLNQTTKVIVPASNATQNHVIIRRKPEGVITLECLKDQHYGYWNCKGYTFGYMCKHMIMAIVKATEENGYTPYFRSSKQDAQWFADNHAKALKKNGKGVVFTLTRHHKNGVASEDRETVYMVLVK